MVFDYAGEFELNLWYANHNRYKQGIFTTIHEYYPDIFERTNRPSIYILCAFDSHIRKIRFNNNNNKNSADLKSLLEF